MNKEKKKESLQFLLAAAKEIFEVRPNGSSSVLLEVTASLKLTVTLITDPIP